MKTLGKIFALSLFILCGTSVHSKNISTGTININTATAYQLSLLPGVGKITAKKMIAAREQKPFINIADLRKRKLIRARYLVQAEKLMSFQGDHRYDIPNTKQRSTQKKSKKQTHWSASYAINKAVKIKDVEELILLTDGQFFHHLSKAISQAKAEIWLSTFVFKSSQNKHNKATQIIQLLKQKAQQGIQVKLLLEQSKYHKDLSAGNHRLAAKLRRHNIQVFFDSVDNTMHSKVVVIDKKHIYLGSHNMTDSALRRNHEVSLMLTSPQLSKELISYFQAIAQEKRSLN